MVPRVLCASLPASLLNPHCCISHRELHWTQPRLKCAGRMCIVLRKLWRHREAKPKFTYAIVSKCTVRTVYVCAGRDGRMAGSTTAAVAGLHDLCSASPLKLSYMPTRNHVLYISWCRSLAAGVLWMLCTPTRGQSSIDIASQPSPDPAQFCQMVTSVPELVDRLTGNRLNYLCVQLEKSTTTWCAL